MLIDSHCHLTDTRFDEDRLGILAAAGVGGLTGVVTIASDAQDSETVATLVSDLGDSRGTNGGPFLWGTAGIHPHEAESARNGDLDRVRHLAASEAGIVAIGETGLDFFYDNSPRDVQVRLFEAQLELAAELDMPVVVHSRSAEIETIDLLRAVGSEVRGVLHCFTGNAELLDAGLAADWYVSFSGIVTFKKFDDASAVRRVPRDRLLVETDAPYLAPVPFRGKRNEPAFVRYVAEAVALHREEDAADVATYTAQNALRFYGLEDVLAGGEA